MGIPSAGSDNRAGMCKDVAAPSVLSAPPFFGHFLLVFPVNCLSPSGALGFGRRASGVSGSASCNRKLYSHLPPREGKRSMSRSSDVRYSPSYRATPSGGTVGCRR